MNDVEFSDKYQPLFNLLLENDEVLKKVDTILMSGGRDSGKTFTLGCFVGTASSDYGHRVLYTRQTMASTSNSIVKALDNRLELLQLDGDFNFSNNEYTSKSCPGCISITGQKTSTGTDTAKLKSIEDYSIFVTDEGEELKNFEDWKKIKRAIRAQDVQCLNVISFNPPSKSHWLFKEFYTKVPVGFNGIVDNVLYIHTTYLDNGRENMALHNWLDYERLRKMYEYYLETPEDSKHLLPREVVSAYNEYRFIVLGEFRDVAEGVIFTYTIGKYVVPEYGEVIGADQGWTHPSAFIRVNVDKKQKRVYLKEIFYRTNAKEAEIYEAIKDEVGFTRIWCDNAAPLFIRNLYDYGLNIKASKKPKIKDRIFAMLAYDFIIDPDSINLQIEFDNYRWSDKKKKEEPIDAFNHGIDATGYAFTMKMRERIAQAQ